MTQASVSGKQVKAKSHKDPHNRTYATGRRKESSARVWIKPGNGKVSINGRDLDKYFARQSLRVQIHQPFHVTNTTGSFDVFCTVSGGGTTGQAGAIRYGISRALDIYNSDFHTLLKSNGFLTRDSRRVERKKYGRPKARKSFQFSKR